jgi:hypothetical protein
MKFATKPVPLAYLPFSIPFRYDLSLNIILYRQQYQQG